MPEISEAAGTVGETRCDDMTVDIHYDIGGIITVDGEKQRIEGLHIYISQDGEVSNVRAHIGHGKYVTVLSTKKGVEI